VAILYQVVPFSILWLKKSKYAGATILCQDLYRPEMETALYLLKMKKLAKIEIRLQKSELERIRHSAESKGYSTISAYIRAITLEKDLFTEHSLIEIKKSIHQVIEILEKK